MKSLRLGFYFHTFLLLQQEDANEEASKLRQQHQDERYELERTFTTERELLMEQISSLKEEISKLKTELEEYRNPSTEQKFLQWAKSKLEAQYSQKISELQKLLCQEFSEAEQFQSRVEAERNKMREKMTEMENIISEQKQKLRDADGDLVKEKELQEQLLQKLEEERKELQTIKVRLQEQEEQCRER